MTATLSASDYVGEPASRRDLELLRSRSWQLVATTSMLQSPGDFVATDRFGTEIVVRNHDGELTALNNVCAHRNCQIAEKGQGHSAELKCPYHGWRYGVDGKTRKIPAAKNFPDFDRDNHQLDRYPIKLIGQLVLVHVGDQHSDSLEDFSDWQDLLSQGTDSRHWKLIFHDRWEYACDWKVVVEGSLESYHLDEVHSDTFGKDPGEENSEHQMIPSGSSFQTRMRESSFLGRLEERAIRYLIDSFDPTYRHIHVYPGIMASMTDSLTLVYQIFPTSSGHCAMDAFGFSRQSETPNVIQRCVAGVLGLAARRLARKVLTEDAVIFPKVQAGMEQEARRIDQRPRTFGRCEERLHWFGKFWNTACKDNS